MRTIDYSMLPEHMQDGARMYVEEGVEPGGFMYSILCNDFIAAAGQADLKNREALYWWAVWLSNELPRAAWGSVQNVEAWMDKGGFGTKA